MPSFETRPLTERFGTEVIGLDAHRLDAEDRAALRDLFDRTGALVLREVGLDFRTQDDVCRMLIGDEGPGATTARDPAYVSNTEEGGFAPFGRLMYHADMMWHPDPFRVLSLYAMTVEPGSAGTLLTSGVAAWRDLPEALRARVRGKEGVQIRGAVYRRGGDDLLRSVGVDAQATVKPVCAPHPVTGEPVLYVSEQSTDAIAGLPPEESEALIQDLFTYLYAPDLVYEHQWRDGDLLVFDNWAMQHGRANVPADGPARTLRKVIAPMPEAPIRRPTFEGVA